MRLINFAADTDVVKKRIALQPGDFPDGEFMVNPTFSHLKKVEK